MLNTINDIGNYQVERTSDIRKVTENSLSDGSVLIRFHYYDGVVGRLAKGVLKGGEWDAWKDVIAENIRDMGFQSNIGSRKGFENKVNYIFYKKQESHQIGAHGELC